MNDELISLFIDNEMDLDEKTAFVQTIRSDDGFADETLALLDQEKRLRGDVASVIPPVLFQKTKDNLSLRLQRFLYFVTGMAATIFAFLLIQPGFKSDQEKMAVHRVPYRFVIYQPDAQKAEIVGSFTQWKAVSMRSIDNYWQVTLELPEGEHRFAYIFDGQRKVSDPTIPTREKDDFGGENSILEVQWSI